MPFGDWARELRDLLPRGGAGWPRRPGFTAAEVRRLLRSDGADERGGAVLRCLARPGDWLDAPLDVFRCPLRYQRHLPRVVFWYARGDTLDSIGARLDLRRPGWWLEPALALACERIAACLNERPEAYGLRW